MFGSSGRSQKDLVEITSVFFFSFLFCFIQYLLQARIRVLTVDLKASKMQVSTLLDKGKHDDELVQVRETLLSPRARESLGYFHLY